MMVTPVLESFAKCPKMFQNPFNGLAGFAIRNLAAYIQSIVCCGVFINWAFLDVFVGPGVGIGSHMLVGVGSIVIRRRGVAFFLLLHGKRLVQNFVQHGGYI